jgi:hypothetical protein
MAIPFHPHGDISLSGLARRIGQARSEDGDLLFRWPACVQCNVALGFFRPAISFVGISGNCSSMGLHTGDDHKILANFQDCSNPISALSSVGELCRLPQLHDLDLESMRRNGSCEEPAFCWEVSNLKNVRIVLLFAILIASAVPSIFAEQSWHAEQVRNDDMYSSSNNSSIRLMSHRDMLRAPMNLSVGTGFYSDHPISYNSGMGSMTRLVDSGSATSLLHEIDSAHKIEGAIELSAADSSYSWDYSNFQSIASTHMRIDENVTDGKVHIGVLKANEQSDSSIGQQRHPLTDAWKHPAIEIEEDYIGTYHIYKNININTSYGEENIDESWLNCCSGSSSEILWHQPNFINANRVFDFRSGGQISNPSIAL